MTQFSKKGLLAFDLATSWAAHDGINLMYGKFYKPHGVTGIYDDLYNAVVTSLKSNDYDIDVVFEEAAFQSGNAIAAFWPIRTMLHYICEEFSIECTPIPVGTIKKLYGGHGAADKTEVILPKALKEVPNIPYRIMKSGKNKGERRYNTDCSDAIAIYNAELMRNMNEAEFKGRKAWEAETRGQVQIKSFDSKPV